MGLDFSYNIAVAEELGNIRCGGIPMAIGVQASMATPALTRFGSHELKKQFLVPTIAGDFVACLGISEAGAGSDVANIKTTAVRKGDEYVINGGKMWITSGSQADWMCLLANTSEGPPHRNKSLICLPMNLPGIHVAKKIDKLGMKSSDTAQIFFEDVRVPCKNLIGEEGKGFTYQMLQFQEERLWGVAIAGAGEPLPWMSSLGRATLLTCCGQAGATREEEPRSSPRRGSCSSYCVNLAGPLQFAFFQLSDIKCIKALPAGTRPMVWAKLQTSEITNCGKQEKE
uniref:Probable acyl-CoA dehydrogenase 6 n=1 Tax=Cyanistes caeruleus TaxID=156563 RepID=A0A8C0V336_CYACU